MAYLLYTGFAAGITSLLLQQDVRYELKAKDLGTKFKIIVFPESNEFEYVRSNLLSW